jgi:hypothetical protein
MVVPKNLQLHLTAKTTCCEVGDVKTRPCHQSLRDIAPRTGDVWVRTNRRPGWRFALSLAMRRSREFLRSTIGYREGEPMTITEKDMHAALARLAHDEAS